MKSALLMIFIVSIPAAMCVTPVGTLDCPPNEYRSGCGECQPTCGDRHPGPCEQIYCFVPACICKEGFIREKNNSSPCIPTCYCPSKKHYGCDKKDCCGH